MGGLGNQMFQYAAGLAVARRAGLPLKVDIKGLLKYRRHQGYQFDTIFAGNFPQAKPYDFVRVLGLSTRRALRGTVDLVPDFQLRDGARWVRQPTHNFWPDFERISWPCYVAGYWQSAQYFSGVEQDLRAAFSFRLPLDGPNADLATRMSSAPSVAMHIRRGDYVSNVKAARFHGICDWDYYERAMAHIRERVPDAEFYAFSDDPEAVRAHFGADRGVEVVDLNSGPASYLDLQLMTACHHHIVANSSFSWWGAWLASHPNQIVIAPSVWLAGSAEPVVDIYAPGWVTF